MRKLKNPDVRRAIYDDRTVICTPYSPKAPFSIGNAMGRNKLIYALSEISLVVAGEIEKAAHGRARLKLSKGDLVELQCGGDRGKARETGESRNSERRPSGPSTNSKQHWSLRADLHRSRRKSPRKSYHPQDSFLSFESTV